MKKNNIRVSVICTTYNQEDYIAQALESFLSQKCNFQYEILVHDDASTDCTTEIIQHYAELYPELIKPIIRSENQYSQGKPITSYVVNNYAQGEFLAYCEGDDYWTDPLKLQKQVDVLDNNQDFGVCTHQTIVKNLDKNKMYCLCSYGSSRELGLDDVIEYEHQYHHSSVLARRNLDVCIPEFLNECPFDYTRRIYYGISTKVFYIDETMSVYRYGAKNSWTNTQKGLSDSINHYDAFIRMLKKANVYSNFEYSHIFQYGIKIWEFEKKFVTGDFVALNDTSFKAVLSNKKFTTRTKIRILGIGQNLGII